MRFYICLVIGGVIGFILASLCNAAHDGDHDQELGQAYRDGFAAGQAKRRVAIENMTEDWIVAMDQAAPGSTVSLYHQPLADESFGCCGVKPVTAELILAQNVNRLDREIEG